MEPQSLPFPYLLAGCEMSNFCPATWCTIQSPKAMRPWPNTSQIVPNEPFLSSVTIPGDGHLTHTSSDNPTLSCAAAPRAVCTTLLATFLPAPSSLQPPDSNQTACSALPFVLPNNYREKQTTPEGNSATWKAVVLVPSLLR